MRRHSHGCYHGWLLLTDELLRIWSNDANVPMQSVMRRNTAVMRVTVNIGMHMAMFAVVTPFSVIHDH